MAQPQQQPDFAVMSDNITDLGQEFSRKCTVLGQQFLLCGNVPAIAEGNVIAASLAAINQTLQRLENRMEGVETRLGGVETRLGRLETRMDGLENRMGRLETRMDGLENRMGRLETRMDGLETRMDGLDTRMDGLETRMDGLDTRMDGLDTRMGGLDTRVGGLDTRVGRLEAGLRCERLNTAARLYNLGAGMDTTLHPFYSPVTNDVIQRFPQTKEDMNNLSVAQVTELLHQLEHPFRGAPDKKLRHLQIICGCVTVY
ncbi:hypothetical protein EV127DRAFT_485970 [Xylaria flabelliformis]|nr:hypothetical protein EV127DRAFT_485970 [Xylaria flabelliformis]